MKPTIAILLAMTSGLGLYGCGSTPERDTTTPDPSVRTDAGASGVQVPILVEAPTPGTPGEVEPETPDPVVEEAPDPRFDERFRKGLTRGGRFTVLWRPLGDEVPKNEHFEVEVYLYRNKNGELETLPGARLAVSGWMPDHGHGMIRKPRATDFGDGRYVVKGMLLQMGGHWQVFFDVLVDNQSERAQFDLVL